ncbi:MAG: aminotransferase class I/II-fold pyridoxal phosphate-dependent enzyme, partial [Phycisphaerae bacterium]
MPDFKIEPATRIKRLPPYLFGRLNALKLAKRQAGADIIDLGMGNPTDGAPDIVIDKLVEAVKDPRNHRYSASRGIKNLRGEVAKRYAKLYNVELDPEQEVLACIGSKEGFSHLCLAMLGPGDTAVVPDPAFPIHNYAVAPAGRNVLS